VLQFGADDDAVLAMDPETIGKMSPLIQPAKDNARRRNSPSAVAEHCRDWQPSAQSFGFDRVIFRCQESFYPAGAAPAHKETNPRRTKIDVQWRFASKDLFQIELLCERITRLRITREQACLR